ncbi:MAG TPA: hypothetical protein VHM20_05755 [Gammaproteobacteria bacterium]|nr:hypothetical protein [Gammaproteobacteria bacterium]
MFNPSKIVGLKAAKLYLDQLDLSYIVDAMCSASYPLPQWGREDALHCLQLYKNFLWLQKKYHLEPLVPTREIDEFWHNHILYTKNYFQDCLQIFGHYLHHQPASADENPQHLIQSYLKTKELYFKEFGALLK